jgi:beta-glucanase (GH16 family)
VTVAAVVALALLGISLMLIETGRSPSPAEDAQPHPGGSAGSLIWADEFDGPRGRRPEPGKWRFDKGYGWGDRELQAYTDRRSNASLDGRGRLAITARKEAYARPDAGAASYTSARLNTRKRFEFAYGRLEARIRIPSGRGLLPAFWATGSDLNSVGWPASGEFDVMEVNGGHPSMVHATLHGPRRGHEDYTVAAQLRAATPLSDAFHVYGVSWSPGRIAFTLDGRIYAVRTPASLPSGSRWSFDHPFFLLLSLAVGPQWMGPPDATTPWPATMLVDWIRVWSGPKTYCPTGCARSSLPPWRHAQGVERPARSGAEQ